MDETQRPFSTEMDKCGSRSVSFGFNDDGRKERRSSRGCRHTTGVYTLNTDGEELPPLYMFDSSAQHTCNFQVQPSWCKGLPKVNRRYGREEKVSVDSFISVCSKGSMNGSLFRHFIRNVILPLYPNISNECVLVDGKVIKGPVIFKIDSGPGRFKDDIVHVTFFEEMNNIGFKIILSLNNATSEHAELDQFFGSFKGSCRSRTLDHFPDKLETHFFLSEIIWKIRRPKLNQIQ